MHRSYHHRELAELRDQQVRFAPRERRLEQASRAEALLPQLRDDAEYSWRFIAQEVIDYRSEMNPESRFRGATLRRDLLRLIEDLTESARLTIVECNANGERVVLLNELSRRWNVEEKTLQRWRQRDLVSRIFWVSGRSRVGFFESSIARVVSAQPQRLTRGKSFSLIVPREHEQIVAVAKRLAAAGEHQTPIADFIARFFRRSREAIRLLMKRYDETHPHIPIFPFRQMRFPPGDQHRIITARHEGKTIDQIAATFSLSRTSVYRFLAIAEMHKNAKLTLRWKGVTADEAITSFGTVSENNGNDEIPDFQEVSDVATIERAIATPHFDCDETLLTPDEELFLFRRMNLLKCHAATLRERLNPKNPRRSTLRTIERLHREAVAIKKRIASANVRLVYHAAHRHRAFAAGSDIDLLISNGQLTLLETIETFDPSRGNRFSSYTTLALTRSFARPARRIELTTIDAADLTQLIDPYDSISGAEQLSDLVQLDDLLATLSERERQIVTHRFGLSGDAPKTLQEIASLLGVSAERVRQLTARALEHLRDARPPATG